MLTRLVFSTAFFAVVGAGPSVAGVPYVDDRSSPSALIESLYNAINRKEYARAWDYFSGKPAPSFESFAKGYEKTADVQLLTGVVTSEGAAGSTFHTVPVAFMARNGDDDEYYAGCYTVRQAAASIQDPPFRPMQIESGNLKKIAPAALEEALPDSCDGQPNTEFQRGMLAKAREKFERENLAQCPAITNPMPEAASDQVYLIDFRYEGEDATSPPRQFLLFSFPCSMGAYNSIEVYYGWTPLDGIQPLHFAMPDFDFTYEDQESARLKTMAITGFASQAQLANSNYDEKTETITMFSKWRGLGDAAANGAWVFSEGRFVLKHYAVDPTYDENSEDIPVMKDGRLLPLP